jgi:hypothetical protein
MKSRKAQGLPINTLIVIIIAIIALVVIILIFRGQFSALFGSVARIIKSVIGLGESGINI